jgi:hypothetical protein
MRTAAFGCFLAALSTTSTIAGVIDEPLRATLRQMARDDQEAIRLSAAHPDRQLTTAESMRISEMLRRNGDLIRRIVQEHGWPGSSLVGDDGAGGAKAP